MSRDMCHVRDPGHRPGLFARSTYDSVGTGYFWIFGSTVISVAPPAIAWATSIPVERIPMYPRKLREDPRMVGAERFYLEPKVAGGLEESRPTSSLPVDILDGDLGQRPPITPRARVGQCAQHARGQPLRCRSASITGRGCRVALSRLPGVLSVAVPECVVIGNPLIEVIWHGELPC